MSLFFKILPISNTGVYAAFFLATIHFLYPKLGSIFDMEYYIHLQICLSGLKSPQVLCRTNSCSPSRGETKWPHCMLAPATPTISGCKQGKCLSYLPDCMGGAIANCMGGEGVVPAPFEPPLTGDTPFKILPVQSILHIYGKGEPKNHQLF